jgi:hypothetical protein
VVKSLKLEAWMIHRIDETLRDEARRFHLVFACPDCASFDPDGDRCSLGFPHQPHREARLDDRAEVVFCKTFELW